MSKMDIANSIGIGFTVVGFFVSIATLIKVEGVKGAILDNKKNIELINCLDKLEKFYNEKLKTLKTLISSGEYSSRGRSSKEFEDIFAELNDIILQLKKLCNYNLKIEGLENVEKAHQTYEEEKNLENYKILSKSIDNLIVSLDKLKKERVEGMK